MLDDDIEDFIKTFGDGLRALIAKREAGARKGAMARIMAVVAANVSVGDDLEADAASAESGKKPVVVKAPRGSVERVVTAAMDFFEEGFAIREVLEHAEQAGLPKVSDGSIRNHLRDLEKDGKVKRKGDLWIPIEEQPALAPQIVTTGWGMPAQPSEPQTTSERADPMWGRF